MLEKAWGGFEAHTEQGFNVGRPPYGYLADKVPHPVAARREQGATKHVLAPDPVRGPVVRTIFEIRVSERLGYQAIADRLNNDLDRYPPPVATAKHRSVGRWTYSSVREVLTNPKYTGYMVWNRKATTSAGGRNNPPEAWIWSSAPTHPALVSVEAFTDAQKVARDREGSRSCPGPNTAHADTRRSYGLRSYMTCGLCGRRMFGKESRGRIYYICRPARAYRPEGHPASIWVREEPLMAGLTEFFNREIFGPHRRERLRVLLARVDDRHLHEHRERLVAVERQIAELKRRKERVLDSLETADDPTPAFVNSINERTTRIGADLEAKQTTLRELREEIPVAPCPQLLDHYPTGTVDLDLLPEPTLRRLLDAFAVQMRHDKQSNQVDVQVTITPETADTQLRAANAAIMGDDGGADGGLAAMRVVPPTGFEPALPP
ncbi:recombinase family protein [Spirillospora sp. NPDC048823]|uniref:recombinase family protein n=1 Tax=unclassified Spirillospora TaxID=2642701 RepID=UPI003718C9A9